MAVLPASTNHQYRGANIAAWFLLLSGFLEVVPGLIHYFIPLPAAEQIAGLALGHNAALVIGMFSWTGAVQIPFGLALMLVAVRFRSLVPLFLLLNFLERGLMTLAAWVLYPAPHHPPEAYVSPVSAAVLLVFFLLSLRTA
jgi:hypothetical protein